MNLSVNIFLKLRIKYLYAQNIISNTTSCNYQKQTFIEVELMQTLRRLAGYDLQDFVIGL